tara:strand:- start:33234 stop:33512 length:279 start_codon:yes stop_codon:yes gene_type:complete
MAITIINSFKIEINNISEGVDIIEFLENNNIPEYYGSSRPYKFIIFDNIRPLEYFTTDKIGNYNYHGNIPTITYPEFTSLYLREKIIDSILK